MKDNKEAYSEAVETKENALSEGGVKLTDEELEGAAGGAGGFIKLDVELFR
ncbi:MAG: hypothetical protein LIO87_10930 [Eubacterium sp.]|nr:hypothetical protein [Eubacterium sp.]